MSHSRLTSKAAWDWAGALDTGDFLDFRGTIADPLWLYGIESDDVGTVVENISQQTLRLAPESRPDKYALGKVESAVMGCEKLRTWATCLEMSGGTGCEPWRLFYGTNFVGDLEQAVNRGRNRERNLGGSDVSLQNDGHEFLKYSALHFKNAHKVQSNDDAHSGARDARFCVSLAVDSLPAFETVPPDQIASWRHLLLSNILDIFFDTTAQHLAKLGFERNANVDPGTAPPTAKGQPNAPNSLIFPFFVVACDEHSGKCCVNSGDKSHSSCNTPVCPFHLPASVVCATALEVLRRLEGVAESDGKSSSSSETQLPTVVAMTFKGKHVGMWAVDKIDHTDIHKAGTCIWSGDMTRLRDVLELTVIFNNIAVWAATTFRSWVSRRVAQWMSLFPPDLAEGEEDEQIDDLGVRIGNLRISRTGSFKVDGSSETLRGPNIG